MRLIGVLTLAVLLLIFNANQLGAQVLESYNNTSNFKQASKKAFTSDPSNLLQYGATFSGSSGLVTIPTPSYSDDKVGLSFKKGFFEHEIQIDGLVTLLEKEETYYSLRYNQASNLEFTLNLFQFDRETKPTLGTIDYFGKLRGVGIKYTSEYEENGLMAVGCTFSPMNIEELNRSDLEHIEYFRNLYLTYSEKLARGLTGHIHFAYAFTRKQTINFPSGNTRTIDRNNILIFGAGLDYKLMDLFSVFSELKVGNYRDILIEKTTRFKINSGIRFGNNSINFEALFLNITDSSRTAVFGVNLAY